MNFSQIDIADIISRIIVSDLAAGPVETFNFDYFSVLDSASEWDWMRFS